MRSLRLLSVAFALAALSPSWWALAGLLHASIDHHHGVEAGADALVSHETLAGLAAHGHYHPTGEPDHDHPAISGGPDGSLQRAPDLLHESTFSAIASVFRDAPLPVSQLERAAPAPPPKLCGPALLASLSILRI